MSWIIEYIEKAKDDLRGLEGSQRKQVLKAIQKVSQNPLPDYEGGYGKPLGNKSGNNLSGYYKIKLLKPGIRVVYTIIRNKEKMRIIVISIRNEGEVYEIPADRI